MRLHIFHMTTECMSNQTMSFRSATRNPYNVQTDCLGEISIGPMPWLIVLLLTGMVLNARFAFAQAPGSAEQRTSRYMESVRHKPPLLLAFTKGMPKGGDLHNHLFGAIYAESLINFAAKDGLCVDHTTSVLIAPPCDPCQKYANKPAMACAYEDQVLYNQIVDAWSMRNWSRSEDSGHDHFFASFYK